VASYKYTTTVGASIGELWAQRIDSEDRQIAVKRQIKIGYALCARPISDGGELAYWYEPIGSSNALEFGTRK